MIFCFFPDVILLLRPTKCDESAAWSGGSFTSFVDNPKVVIYWPVLVINMIDPAGSPDQRSSLIHMSDIKILFFILFFYCLWSWSQKATLTAHLIKLGYTVFITVLFTGSGGNHSASQVFLFITVDKLKSYSSHVVIWICRLDLPEMGEYGTIIPC